MAHCFKESRLRSARLPCFVAHRSQLRVDPFALGDVLIGAVQILWHALGAEHLASQQDGGDTSLAGHNAVIQLDPVALEGIAERLDQRRPIGRKYLAKQAFRVQLIGLAIKSVAPIR
jgi:hypothetical protein